MSDLLPLINADAQSSGKSPLFACASGFAMCSSVKYRLFPPVDGGKGQN
jgi:hypothetical protein